MKISLVFLFGLLVNLALTQNRYQQIVETEYRGDTLVLISTKEPVAGIVYLADKDDGFLMEEQYFNGIKNGYSKMLKNNIVLTSENYKNGVQEGESKSYHDDGQKKSESFYKGGIQEGITRYWHPNGQLKYEVNIVNGLDEGSLKVFYENGKIQFDQNYVNGKLEGKSIECYESGEMKKMEFWKDGLLDGNSIGYSTEGLFTFKILYKAGKRHGKCQWFMPIGFPGQMKCEANYENDEQNGLTTMWHDNGQVYHKGNYKSGRIDGICRSWHPNGKKSIQIKWKSEKMVYEKFWDENGNKIKYDGPPIPPPPHSIYKD